jgi:hypothetical protein
MNNVTITLPIDAWNAILNSLGARPFSEVAALITEIQRQAQPQIPAEEAAAEEKPEAA